MLHLRCDQPLHHARGGYFLQLGLRRVQVPGMEFTVDVSLRNTDKQRTVVVNAHRREKALNSVSEDQCASGSLEIIQGDYRVT